MTGTATPTAPSLSPSLSASDRCDRCCAQGRVRAVLANGDLIFCAHHANAYGDKLRASALEWVDETSFLTSQR